MLHDEPCRLVDESLVVGVQLYSFRGVRFFYRCCCGIGRLLSQLGLIVVVSLSSLIVVRMLG